VTKKSNKRSDRSSPLDALNFPYKGAGQCIVSMFRDMTASYKPLFFIAILDAIAQNKHENDGEIALVDLNRNIATTALYAAVTAKLSFGSQDTLQTRLQGLFAGPKVNYKDAKRDLERMTDSEVRDNFGFLGKYAPKALLTSFVTVTPLYGFSRGKIKLDKKWLAFLLEHNHLLREYSTYSLAVWLQRKNPGVPGVVDKISLQDERPPIPKFMKDAWQKAMGPNFKCIYVNELVGDRFALDHYLPWSFVGGHDLWNLVPTSPDVNNQKSDDLPPERTQKGFSEVFWTAFVRPHRGSKKEVTKAQLNISDGLRTTWSDIVKMKQHNFIELHTDKIKLLWQLAKHQGFDEWTIKQKGVRISA
jgi:hypothetical protein